MLRWLLGKENKKNLYCIAGPVTFMDYFAFAFVSLLVIGFLYLTFIRIPIHLKQKFDALAGDDRRKFIKDFVLVILFFLSLVLLIVFSLISNNEKGLSLESVSTGNYIEVNGMLIPSSANVSPMSDSADILYYLWLAMSILTTLFFGVVFFFLKRYMNARIAVLFLLLSLSIVFVSGNIFLSAHAGCA